MKVCTLASGSSGNSVFVKAGGSSVIIDAGLSGKGIEQRMCSIGESCEDLSAILVTHEHVDHIKGVGVLARRFDLPIYTTERTWDELRYSLGKINEDRVELFSPGEALDIGELKLESFSVSHDAADPVGYVCYDREVKASLVTDTGCMTAEIVKKIRGSDCFVLEANHDIDMLHNGSYPWHLKKRIAGNRGHLSNAVSGHTLASVISGRTKCVTLAHLSQENNDPDIAFKTVKDILADNGIIGGEDVALEVAPRFNAGKSMNVR